MKIHSAKWNGKPIVVICQYETYTLCSWYGCDKKFSVSNNEIELNINSENKLNKK